MEVKMKKLWLGNCVMDLDLTRIEWQRDPLSLL